MTWQEYQEAVAVLYERADGFGDVRRNVMVPDKVTGQPRQVDVLIDVGVKGHSVSLLVDAKFYASRVDVRDVESVLALADAVSADKAIIVAANGWTEPAGRKAEHANLDLRLLPLEGAPDLIVPEKWKMCPSCSRDCIVMDQDGLIEWRGTFIWWLAGQCRACRCARMDCQDCGSKLYVELDESAICGCGHQWSSTSSGATVALFAAPPEW